MVDFRAYRIAFVATLLAVVALMFSLQGAPPALEAVRPPASFDPGAATATARQIASTAPHRPPGSDGDAAIADLVASRFAAIGGAGVSEQEVTASLDGEDVTLRNVILTLPGSSRETLVVLAGRDSPIGAGGASSAAATGLLVELAEGLATTSHDMTYVLASTSGATEGADGVRRLIDGLLDGVAVEAILVLSQPGFADPRPPFVVTTSTDPTRTPAQLAATARRAVSSQIDHPDPRPGALLQLARLAFPSGLGEQAPLLEAGFDAVAISSAGERPLAPANDGPESLSRTVLAGFGRAATSIVEAIDVAEAPLEPSPQPYLEIGDNLVPGWSLALLALALLIPALVAAVGATGSALRRSQELGGALAWAGSRALPALSGLAVLYALAVVGIVPRPSFPFDPGRFEIDVRAVVASVLIAAAIVATAVARPPLRPPAHVPRSSLVAALGVTSVAAGLVAWVANPYLAMLLAPATHVWLVGAAVDRRRPVAVVAVVAAASLLPLALALAGLASALELGAEAPWILLLMVANGQIGIWVALALCFMVGALVGTVAVAGDTPSLRRSLPNRPGSGTDARSGWSSVEP
jgi:hypothetical protein